MARGLRIEGSRRAPGGADAANCSIASRIRWRWSAPSPTRPCRATAWPTPAKPSSARLMTLSRAHDLLTQASWASAPIRDVVEGALAAHRTGQRPDQHQRTRSASDRQAGPGARGRHPRTRDQRHQIRRAVRPRQRRRGVVRSTGRWRRNLQLHLDRERRPRGDRADAKRLWLAADRTNAAERFRRRGADVLPAGRRGVRTDVAVGQAEFEVSRATASGERPISSSNSFVSWMLRRSACGDCRL